MQVHVVTPEGVFYEGDAIHLQVPAHDGFIGVLDNHAPMVAELGAGPMTISRGSGQEDQIILFGGHIQILKNKVSILATKAFQPGNIDSSLIQKDLDKALSQKTITDHDIEKRERAISRARTLLSLA